MVSNCPNHPSRIMSPRPTLAATLRGVAKRQTTNCFNTTKPKKAQRALCTVFEESALTASSPLFAFKAAWLQSPTSRPSRLNIKPIHPALGRLRVQELRDAPTTRKATPIKDRQLMLRASFGRHRMQGELDTLADELGTCQLQSATKPAAPQPSIQAPKGLELTPLAIMQDD